MAELRAHPEGCPFESDSPLMKQRTEEQIVNVHTETTLHFAEHERMLSFNGDSDAIHFDEWWQDDGAARFVKYVNKQDQIERRQ